jgi:hypothetical protein
VKTEITRVRELGVAESMTKPNDQGRTIYKKTMNRDAWHRRVACHTLPLTRLVSTCLSLLFCEPANKRIVYV